MELTDKFSKEDAQLESSVKRNENVYLATAEELDQEAKLVIEKQVRGGKKEIQTIEQYIKNFKWDSHKFPMDKSLKVIGAKILSIQKTCDEKLKKQVEDQNDIKNKLAALQKKESNSLLQKDLGDLVYEKKISSQLFVNTHQSSVMTTVLVVVNKKMLDKFKEIYSTVLIDHYENDFENWQKRALANVQHQNQNIEDEAQRNEIVQAEFAAVKAKHVSMMKLPGVVPGSDKYLNHEDNDGNQLHRVTTLVD